MSDIPIYVCNVKQEKKEMPRCLICINYADYDYILYEIMHQCQIDFEIQIDIDGESE